MTEESKIRTLVISTAPTEWQEKLEREISKAISSALEQFHAQAEENMKILMRGGFNILHLEEERDLNGVKKIFVVGFWVETLEKDRILVGILVMPSLAHV